MRALDAERARESGAARAALLALLALGASVFSLALAEVGLRVLGVQSNVRAHFEPGPFAQDAELGWKLLENYRGSWFADDDRIATSVNAQGFRGPDWDPARAQAPLRVLALGDSCTFGMGVGDTETYPSQLEALLNERGRTAAVFNAGVPGYDSVQEQRTQERLLPRVRPQVVIVTWLSNDLTVSSAQPIQVLDHQLVENPEHYGEWRERVEHRGVNASALYRFIRVRWRLLEDRFGRDRRSDVGAISPERFTPSTAALAEIQTRAAAAGARMILVPLPRREQAEGIMPVDDLTHIAEFGRARGMEVVPVLDRWPKNDRTGYYLSDNVHLSAFGYRALAEAIAEAPALRDAPPDRGRTNSSSEGGSD